MGGKVISFVQTVPAPGFFRSPSTYNDTEVGSSSTFASYTEKKYDKRIDWTINHQIGITIVHDVGFERADEMVSVSSTQGQEITTYTVTR